MAEYGVVGEISLAVARQFTTDQRKQLLSSFFQRDKLRFNRCLAPGMACTLDAIGAHSLPNSSVLELVARDGHVKAIRKRIHAGIGPVFVFEDVGRNQATTFEGFCAQHDFDIFETVDRGPIDISSEKHLFLIAYRAVTRELHALMDGAFKIQLTYQKRVEIGVDPVDEPSRAGLLAIDHMLLAYDTYVYKCEFDKALTSGDYGNVIHAIIQLDDQVPSLAVCSLFSTDATDRMPAVRIILNVLPLSNTKSVAVFSFLSFDASWAEKWLDMILGSSGYRQKYLLSKVILTHCENFVVSPTYFDTWTRAKELKVTEYFAATLLSSKFETEDGDLYLF